MSLSLYQYNKKFEEYLNNPQFDEMTGELLPPDFAMEKDEAIDNYLSWYKNQCLLQDGLKQEIKRMQERSKQIDKTIVFIKKQLELATEGRKYETKKGKITYKKTKSLVVDNPELLMLMGYARVKSEPDKARAKEDLLNGMKNPYCHIEEKNTVIIK